MPHAGLREFHGVDDPDEPAVDDEFVLAAPDNVSSVSTFARGLLKQILADR
ncbi:hypothetical protein [Rhodococcus sp. 05-2254-6]|uniref:hypothetical protein n=1 Tax=Rhodococcus sp. 05-2254-6 TaxID=2022489 RepID=UPI00211B0F40|nr:hypothetical protein [Rhodococcus sp. 05-2254-6]